MVRAGLSADRITVAAADLADEVGFDKITVTALARGFGVKDASLYSHVRSAEDLRLRVARLAALDFADALGAAVAGRAGPQAVTAFADAYRRFALAHPGRYAATQYQIAPEVTMESPGHLRLMELTAATLRSYGLSEADQTDAVRMLRSAITGFVAIEQSGGFQHSRDVETSWNRMVAALAQLLAQWPPG
jgi:AcrR family transcriptional regulator